MDIRHKNQQYRNNSQEEELANKYQDFIGEAEARDGVRFSWNQFPPNRIEGTRNVVPLGCLFTPLQQRTDLPKINYPPLLCQQQNCRGVINPYAKIDFQNRVWTCPFCIHRNPFPQSYARMTEENKPAELHADYSTIEYTLPPRPGATTDKAPPPIFLFVIDTCLAEAEELSSLKSSIQTSLSLLPADSLVGLITFGKMVQLHELNPNSSIPRSYVFRGSKDVAVKQLKSMLALGRQTPSQVQQEQGQQQGSMCNFLQPLSTIDLYFNTLIEDIQLDPWPTQAKKRPIRATGVALSIAIGLLESTYPNCSARMLTFIGGPATDGPGMVVDTDRANTMRSWMDIEKDNARFIKKSVRHYKALAVRAATAGHAVDIFACCLDQTGIYELKTLCTSTGGYLIMCDSFKSSLFEQTYQRVFNADEQGSLEMGFAATIEIKCSREIKLQGILGSCVSLNVKSSSVAEEEIGVGGTSQYRVCALDPGASYAVYLQVSNPNSNPLPPNTLGYIQFCSNYTHADGTRRVRVTTVARNFADPNNPSASVAGFDQEASAVLMARLATHRCEKEEPAADVLRWLDRTLIRLCQKVGVYQPEQPESFRFPVSVARFPEYLFHLRRTGFLNVFGHSPDETAYHRYQLCRQNIHEAIIMIQPSLFSYSFNGPPEIVSLDAQSLLPDRILLLDSFFQVLIYHGEHIHAWVKQGLLEKEEYANLKQLVAAPIEDAREILATRFPIPRYIETQVGGSQARFLLARVNPSKNYQDVWNQQGGATVLSDDVNLQNFVDHLKKLAVAPS